MRLQCMTWLEVEEYLERSRGVIVPAGSTEQHGPMGLIGTDAICAEVVATAVSERVGAVMAPTLAYGMSEHHMGFAGSVTLRPTTLIAVTVDVVLSLARHGFRRLLFINGHGGNTASLQAAFFEAYTEAARWLDDPAELRCEVAQWWECSAMAELREPLFGDRDGDHGSASELSLVRLVHPDRVPRVGGLPEAAPSGPVFGAADFRRRYPDGRMGSDPSLASAEHGRTILDAVAGELADRYRSFVSEP